MVGAVVGDGVGEVGKVGTVVVDGVGLETLVKVQW